MLKSQANFPKIYCILQQLFEQAFVHLLRMKKNSPGMKNIFRGIPLSQEDQVYVDRLNVIIVRKEKPMKFCLSFALIVAVF